MNWYLIQSKWREKMRRYAYTRIHNFSLPGKVFSLIRETVCIRKSETLHRTFHKLQVIHTGKLSLRYCYAYVIQNFLQRQFFREIITTKLQWFPFIEMNFLNWIWKKKAQNGWMICKRVGSGPMGKQHRKAVKQTLSHSDWLFCVSF